MKYASVILFSMFALPVVAGETIDLADIEPTGSWAVRDGWLVPTDMSSVDNYSGEGPKVVLPRTVGGDFTFACEFGGPGSSGAGGAVVYFGLGSDGTGYAFRYISHWGTAVLHCVTADGLYRQIGYATGVKLGSGDVHSLSIRVCDGKATVALDGRRPSRTQNSATTEAAGLPLPARSGRFIFEISA